MTEELIQFEYVARPSDAFASRQLARRYWYRAGWLALRIASNAVIAGGLILIAASVVVPGFILIVSGILSLSDATVRIRIWFTPASQASWKQRWEQTYNETGLRATSGGQSVEVKWESVRRALDARNIILLETAIRGAMLIPEWALAHRDLERLRDLLKRKLGANYQRV